MKLNSQYIIYDYQHGMSSIDIARKHQCSKGAVLYILKQHGIQRRSNSRKGSKNRIPTSTKSQLLHQRFGALVVTDYVTGGCLCQCDCGNNHIIKPCRLLDGSYQSCGCRLMSKNSHHYNWKGVGFIPMSNFSSIKHGAERRKLLFDVSIEYLNKVLILQNHHCALSQSPIVLTGRKGTTTASLDRIDSSQGYIEGNVQWVHKIVNQMKWNIPQDEFILWCKAIAISMPLPSPALYN